MLLIVKNRHDLAFILKLKMIAIMFYLKKYIFFVVNTTIFCFFLRKYILNNNQLSVGMGTETRYLIGLGAKL